MLKQLGAFVTRHPFGTVVVLLTVFATEITLSIPEQSQTFDESVHLFSGYQYWRHLDFGSNPEHPPLLKLVAASPLVALPLKDSPTLAGPTKAIHFRGSLDFLYRNTVPAARLLFVGRLAASTFACVLVLLVFGMGRALFDTNTGLIAATILVFEPNLLANAPLVTTDAAVTTCLFATVLAYFRYTTSPSATRLLLCGLAAALTLSSKHSAVLLVGILPLLAGGDLLLSGRGDTPIGARLTRVALTLTAIFVLAALGLWVLYAFRFTARPPGFELSPSLDAYAKTLTSPLQSSTITAASRWHLLPESYLWGLTDVLVATEGRATFLLGRVYERGQWFYFPLVFGMKTTLSMLILLAMAPFTLSWWRQAVPATQPPSLSRAVWFLTAPCLVWLGVSMTSGLNIGFRHVLPLVPFLTVLAAVSARAAARRATVGAWAVTALIVWHAVSSLTAFPNYLTYSNELAGGPSNTHRVMTDSNADWGQGLVQASHYLAQSGVRDCWLAYNVPFIDAKNFAIPCRRLHAGRFEVFPEHPAVVQGTILVSSTVVNGHSWGPGELNPYGFLREHRPEALLANAILVFNGRFDLSLAAAVNHARRAQQLLADQRLNEAIPLAQEAVRLAPTSAETQATMCLVLMGIGSSADARPYCDQALTIADRVHPEYQYLRVQPVRSVASLIRH